MLDLSPVELGHGFFGAVYKGFYTPSATIANAANGENDQVANECEKKMVAVKRMHRRHSKRDRFCTNNQLLNLSCGNLELRSCARSR